MGGAAPCPPTMSSRGRRREKGEKVDKEGADRRAPHISGCRVWLVVSELAGYVGPKELGGLAV
jgi:hypothetical protein